jgi:chemotaxis signal transduction protein
MNARGVLLMRTGGRQLGLPLAEVLEVGDVPDVVLVPGTAPAVRGITRVRGRLVPLAHLGALLSGGTCPPATAERTLVLAAVADRWVALEVDEVDAAPEAEVRPPPEGTGLGHWAVGVVRRGEVWIPILSLEALAERLQA